MEELKPCPFCGESPIIGDMSCPTSRNIDKYDGYQTYVYCNCGSGVSGLLCKVENEALESAVNLWNRREETLRESYCRLIEECIHLKEQREKLKNCMNCEYQSWNKGPSPCSKHGFDCRNSPIGSENDKSYWKIKA